MTAATPVLDVVVPVHDEEHVLAACVDRLVLHLRATFPYPFRVTVADNASTDGTWAVARGLEARLPEVVAVRLERKGRGRALRHVWLASPAPVLAYVDVDLSTDLDALWPLVAPLMSGHSDLAIGSRLAHGARVVRGTRRELVSRTYNLLLRVVVGAATTDAQCGFKAVRRDVAHELLPMVEDTTWFFDTELLLLAQACRLRVHEVPVDWFDDPDSRVDVVRTALDDLRGLWRVHRALRSDRLPVDDVARRMGRLMPATGTLGTQLWRFAAVGALSTLVHLGLFAALHAGGLASQAANVLALVVATVVNTAANRRWTFGRTGPHHRLRHQLQGLVLTALTWAMTAGALALLSTTPTPAPTWVQTVVLAASAALATATRFALMRWWVFRPSTGPGAPAPVPVDPEPVLRRVPQPTRER